MKTAKRRPIDAAVQHIAEIAVGSMQVIADDVFGRRKLDRRLIVDFAAGPAFWAGVQTAAAFCARHPDKVAAFYSGVQSAYEADPLAEDAVSENVTRLLAAVEAETAERRLDA